MIIFLNLHNRNLKLSFNNERLILLSIWRKNGENIFILLIVLITSCLWGQETISETIDSKENKIIKLLQKDKVELIVVGEVVDDIEDEEELYKLKKLYKIQEENLESSNDYLSEDEIKKETIKEKKSRKLLIKNLKSKLSVLFSEVEVTNE